MTHYSKNFDKDTGLFALLNFYELDFDDDFYLYAKDKDSWDKSRNPKEIKELLGYNLETRRKYTFGSYGLVYYGKGLIKYEDNLAVYQLLLAGYLVPKKIDYVPKDGEMFYFINLLSGEKDYEIKQAFKDDLNPVLFHYLTCKKKKPVCEDYSIIFRCYRTFEEAEYYANKLVLKCKKED